MTEIYSSELDVVRLGDARHNGGDQLYQLLGALLCRLQNLLVVGLLFTVVVHHGLVGYKGEGKDLHSRVAGHYYLMDCAHS